LLIGPGGAAATAALFLFRELRISLKSNLHAGILRNVLPTSGGGIVIRTLVFAGILLACLIGAQGTPAEAAGSLDECSKIQDDAARLRCYDEMAGRKPRGAATETDVSPVETGKAEAKAPPSYLSRKWQLDEESRKGRFAITTYKQNYLLPYTYNLTQNKELYAAANPGTEIQDYEAKFQISLKVKLWESILGTNTDLWLGYTQLSFWQVYNTDFSSPFRETNYEPEILLNFRTDTDVFGLMRNRFIQIGLNHQSNGRGEPLSRSWNRIVANFGFERGDFDLVLKTWARIPESEENDDNPDITSYLGYGEIWLGYFWKDCHLGAMFRNNLRFDENRSALQLELSFPLVERINGYVQYFTGYGESLIDYNHYTNRIGVGFMIRDW
jgi:phospholipase A1